MSAPPPPGLPGTRAYRGASDERQALAAAAAVGELFALAARTRQQPQARAQQSRRPQAHARQGDERGLFLTADQWKSYDEFQALMARQERKYGHFRSVAALMNRSIW